MQHIWMEKEKNVVVGKFGVGKSVSENSVSENLLSKKSPDTNAPLVPMTDEPKGTYVSKVAFPAKFVEISCIKWFYNIYAYRVVIAL